MNKEATVAEVLLAAADHIEKVGLNKGAYYKGVDSDRGVGWALGHARPDAPCCVLGAFHRVAPDINMAERCGSALADAIGISAWDLPDWNDKPGQRASRVVAALRRAAGLVTA